MTRWKTHWSDGEPFEDWETCDRCNFRKKPSADTCKNCISGDRWNRVNWDDEEEEERIQEAAFTEYVLGARR